MTEKTIQAWADIWNGELALIDGTVAEDFVAHAAPVLGGPPATTTGRDHLSTWIGGIRSVMPDLMFTVQVGPIVDEPFIVVRWHARGTYEGGLPGTPDDAVGRQISFYGTDILRMAGGLIAEYWVNGDSLWVAQQLGVVSEAGQDCDISPRSRSWRRDVMPSLRKMLRRWASMVRGLRNSRAATSLEVAPVATSRAMCSSCIVSWS